MDENIRVVIADDHTIVRSGVRLLVESEPDIEVIGEAVDGYEVLALVENIQPHVVIMDIGMPELDGLEATRQIKAQWPAVNVLVLTMHREDEYFFEMLRAGASGYVLKGGDTRDLVNAVRIVASGEVFLYPSMAQLLVQDYLNRIDGEEDAGPVLSRREKEVLTLIAQGYRSSDIAEELVISPSTVNTHRGNIMSKLGLSTRPELVRYARQHGYLQDS